MLRNARRRQTKKLRRHSRRFRPQFETLEARLALATADFGDFVFDANRADFTDGGNRMSVDEPVILRLDGTPLLTFSGGVSYTKNDLGGQFTPQGTVRLWDKATIYDGLALLDATAQTKIDAKELLKDGATLKAAEAKPLKLFAFNFTANKLQIAKKGRTHVVRMQGRIGLPAPLTSLSTELKNSTYVEAGQDGLQIGGNPDIVVNGGFSLKGFKLEADSLRLRYDKGKQQLQLSGGVKLKLTDKNSVSTKIDPMTPLLISTRTGKVSVGDDGMLISGDLKIGSFAAKAMLLYKNNGNELTVAPNVMVHLPQGINLEGSFETQGDQLTRIALGIGTAKKPIKIGTTGFEITKATITLENLNDLSNLVFMGSMDVRTIAKIGKNHIVSATGTLTVDKNHLNLAVTNGKLLGGTVGTFGGSIDINWTKGVYMIDANMKLFEVVDASAKLYFDSKGNVTADAKVTLEIPRGKGIPFGGTKLFEGDFYLQIRPVGSNSDNFVRVSGSVANIHIGFQVDFEGKFTSLGDVPVTKNTTCVGFIECTYADSQAPIHDYYDYNTITVTSDAFKTPGFNTAQTRLSVTYFDKNGITVLRGLEFDENNLLTRVNISTANQYTIDKLDGTNKECKAVTVDQPCAFHEESSDTITIRVPAISQHEAGLDRVGMLELGKLFRARNGKVTKDDLQNLWPSRDVAKIKVGIFNQKGVRAINGEKPKFAISGHIKAPIVENLGVFPDVRDTLISVNWTPPNLDEAAAAKNPSTVSLLYFDQKTGARGLISEFKYKYNKDCKDPKHNKNIPNFLDCSLVDDLGKVTYRFKWDGFPDLYNRSQDPEIDGDQPSFRFFAVVADPTNIAYSPYSAAFTPPNLNLNIKTEPTIVTEVALKNAVKVSEDLPLKYLVTLSVPEDEAFFVSKDDALFPASEKQTVYQSSQKELISLEQVEELLSSLSIRKDKSFTGRSNLRVLVISPAGGIEADIVKDIPIVDEPFTFTTTVSLFDDQVGNKILLINDADGGDTDDKLTISSANDVFTISANHDLGTSIKDAKGHTTKTITVPIAAVTSGRIIVNTRAGTDKVTVAGLDTDRLLDLQVKGAEAVVFDTKKTDLRGGSLDVRATTINVDTNLTTSGEGDVILIADKSIDLESDARVSTANGLIYLFANLQTPPTTGDFTGITINGGTVESTGTGEVSVLGKGGNHTGGLQYGVLVRNGGNIIGGTTGTLRVQGWGGVGGTTANVGVGIFHEGSIVTSNGSDISLTGHGGGAAGSKLDIGVLLQEGGVVRGARNGSLNIQGTGRAGDSSNYGVLVADTNSAITSDGGDVFVTAMGDTGNGGSPLRVARSGSISAPNRTLWLFANDMRISSTPTISARRVIITPVTPQASIDLGTNTDGSLWLTAAELSRITAEEIQVGDNETGAVTVTAPIKLANDGKLQLANGGKVVPGTEGIIRVDGNLVLASSSTFSVSIGGPTPGGEQTEHSQLAVAGDVDIQPGAKLDITLVNGFDPQLGDEFVIVERTSGSGNFEDAPEGTVFENFLGSGKKAVITYEGGDSKHDVIVEIVPPFTRIHLPESVNGGRLLWIEDNANTDDVLAISTDLEQGVFTIRDPNKELRTKIPGATGDRTNTVTVPIASVTAGHIVVNTLGGNDLLAVAGLDTGEALDLSVTSGTEVVVFTAEPTNLHGGSAGILATKIEVDTRLETSGDGNIAFLADESINVRPFSRIATEDGPLYLFANPEAVTAGADFKGIQIDGGTVESRGTGTVLVSGTGGDAVEGFQIGVELINEGLIVGGTGGDLVVEGQGGAGGTHVNAGVRLVDKSLVTSRGANVQVTGWGGGTAGSTHNLGVVLESGSSIAAGKGGTIIVQGTGGVLSGSFNRGVEVGTDSAITSSGGDIFVTAIGGTGDDNMPLWLRSNGRITATDGAEITLLADDIEIDGTASLAAMESKVSIRPVTPGVEIDLGTDTAGKLGLTDAEFDRIAGTISIGGDNTGNVTFTAPLDPADHPLLLVNSGGAIVDANAAGHDFTGAGLVLTGNIQPGAAPATLNVAGLAAFGRDSTLTVEFGAVPQGGAVGHSQLATTGDLVIGTDVKLEMVRGD